VLLSGRGSRDGLSDMPSEIQFDEARHLYTVDGRIIPSVTQILTHNKPNFYKDNGADVTGTIVHKMLEDYDNRLGMEFYGEEYHPHLQQYLEFLKDYPIKYGFIEHRLFNQGLGYCGTVDRAGSCEIKGEVRSIVIDIKTGSSVPSWAALQTAAYAMALAPDNYENCFRAVLHIHPKKNKSYRFKVYEDKADFLKWPKMCMDYHKEMSEMEARQ
jgi:hypothetical protein